MAYTKRVRSARSTYKRRTKPSKKKVSKLSLIPRWSSAQYGIRRASKLYKNPFPRIKLVKHKYVDRIELPAQSTAGLPSWYVMRCNSVYDPDQSGVGHQPMFRDEMAAKYATYLVLSSWCKFVIPAGTSSTKQIFAVIIDDDAGTTGGGADDFSSVLEYNSHTNAQDMGQRQSPLVMSKGWNAAKEYKTTRKALLADTDKYVAKDSNPGSADARYFKLVRFPVSSSDTLSAVRIQVEMTFYVAWINPDNDPTTS